MPELPEVETIRVQLEPLLAGRCITGGGAHPSPKFASAVEAVGCEIGMVRRRGKYLIIGLHDDDNRPPADSQNCKGQAAEPIDGDTPTGSDEGDSPGAGSFIGSSPAASPEEDGADASLELVIHLGMTGRLAVTHEADLAHPHLRAWWRLDDGSVFTFHDVRRFGRVHVVAAGCYSAIATLSRIGPEPFSDEFNGDGLWRSLRSSRRCIKTQLLSQLPVAGVGNIYADEALWSARINPAARRLSRARAGGLAEAIRTALASGLQNRGTTLRDYVTVEGAIGTNQHHLRCYGRAGEPCERCGTELRRRVIDARGTTWCPQCQRH